MKNKNELSKQKICLKLKLKPISRKKVLDKIFRIDLYYKRH